MNRKEVRDKISKRDRILLAAVAEYGNLNYKALCEQWLKTPDYRLPRLRTGLRQILIGLDTGYIVPEMDAEDNDSES